MQYITLGKTNLKIAPLGFGGIPIQRIDKEGTRELILKMRENGLNFIDTARAYTVSEEYLGYALEGIRDDFVIATKSGSRDKESMARDIRTSLKNLRTDYIDLYQLHNVPPNDLPKVLGSEGALEALIEAKEQGIIGHIGITAHSIDTFKMALEIEQIETVMFPYSIVETQGIELIEKCAANNIGFIAMKPLAGGAIDNPELAIRYILKNRNVSVVIPGMATVEELECNLKAAENTSPLTQEEINAIDEIKQGLGTQFCRRCNYCAPCTVGIPISSVFLFEGYLTRYNLTDWANLRYNSLPVKASACVECGVCEARCPYNLPIRQMLKKAVKGFGE